MAFHPTIPNEIKNNLVKMKITEPTKIQQKAIPIIFENKSVYATSQTGTGKTLAYLLPVLSRLDPSIKSAQAVVIAPTHELAIQVNKQAEILLEGTQLKSCAVIGGASISRQIEKLKEKPQIIIGSAGRILDLAKSKKIKMHTVKTIVLDEADRMLDDFNISTVTELVKTTLRDRQILMFSATKNKAILEKAQQCFGEFETIDVSNPNSLPETIEHLFIISEKRDKLENLRKIIAAIEGKKLIFVNSSDDIKAINQKLKHHSVKSDAIYGEALKNERRKALDDFRNGNIDVLLSSDLSARGLDISETGCVINLSIPEEPTHYLHRAGRTGRFSQGVCISLITLNEIRIIKKYEKAFNVKFDEVKIYRGKISKSNKAQL